MTRWLAPILSFTAEEIWQQIPGDHKEFLFVQAWYDELFDLDSNETMNMDFWQQLLETRAAVSKQLETLRVENKIGSSLDAEVTLHCNGSLYKNLSELDDELRFVLITSEAKLENPETAGKDSVETVTSGGEHLRLTTKASSYTKCVRCWHHRADVGSHSEHGELCGRCVENVAGAGEKRRFA